MSIKAKKTKWIIGGGITLAILIAIGAGVGVFFSQSNNNSQDSKQVLPINVKKDLQDKVNSFLTLGLNENKELKTELRKLKVELDDENANVDEIKARISDQIKSYLRNHLNNLASKIEEIEKKEDIKLFDEVYEKLIELKDKKKKLELLTNNENIGNEFLDGTITKDKIQAVVFEKLPKDTSVYVTELAEYKKSLLQLKTLITPLAEETTLNDIQAIYDRIEAKTIKILEVQSMVKNILKPLLDKKINTLKGAVESISETEKEKYTDLKTSFDDTASNIGTLETLNTYIDTNIEDLLKDTSNLNTRFANFATSINIVGEEVLTKFKENKEDISARLDILTKIATGMADNGFSAAIFNDLKTRVADLAILNDGLASINGGTITIDKAIETLETLESTLYGRILAYKGIGLRNQLVIGDLPAETDPNYADQKTLTDYFSNKKGILEAFSTSEGIAGFKTNVTALLAIVVRFDAEKQNLVRKIDALLALGLTTDTKIEKDLTDFKEELDDDGADIAAIKAKVSTKIGEYITVHLEEIKAKIKDIEDNSDITVFDDVANKLLELKSKQATLETLNTANVGANILDGTTTIAQLRETEFTPLTKTIGEYKEDLEKHKAALLYWKTEFENVEVEIQNNIQSLLDNLETKSLLISDILQLLKRSLINYVNSRIADLTALVESVPDDDRNLYTDIQDIINSAISERNIFEGKKTYFETKGDMNTLLLDPVEKTGAKTRFITPENKALIADFVKNKESLKTKTTLLTAIKTALGQTWITKISGFLQTRATIIADLTTALSTYEGLLNRLKLLETKVYNEILKYQNAGGKLKIIKTEIDSLAADPTNSLYLKLKEIYDYLSNKDEVLNDVRTETGVNKIVRNINKLDDSSEFNNLLILKLSMYELAVTTPTGDKREKLLNAGEFDIFQKTGFYCGGTTQEEANTKLQASLQAFQEGQTSAVEPYSIKSNSNFKVRFHKYRDQTNVDVDCWELEVTYRAVLPNGEVIEKPKAQLLADGFNYEGKNYKATEDNGKIYVEIDETTVDFGTPMIELPAFSRYSDPTIKANKGTKYIFDISYGGIGNVVIKNDGKIWRTSNVADGTEPTESVTFDENGMAYIPLSWVGEGTTAVDDAKVVPFTFFNLGASEAAAKIRLATNNAATSLDTIGSHGDRGTANFISYWWRGWMDDDNQPAAAAARTENIDFKIRELKTRNTAGEFVDATVTLPSTVTQAHGYKVDYKAKDLYYPVQMTSGGEGSLLFHGNVQASFDGKLKYGGQEFQVPDKSSVATARDIRVEITNSVFNEALYGTSGSKRDANELFINVESGWLDYFKTTAEKESVKDLARRLGITIRFKVGGADAERNYISTSGVNDSRASEVFFIPEDAASQFTTGNKLAPLKYKLKEELEKTSAYSDSFRTQSRIIEGREKGKFALFPFNSEAEFIAYNKDIFPDGLDFSTTSFPDYLGDSDYGALATVQTASTTANTESVKKKILASNHLIISGATWANDFYDQKMVGQVSANQQDIAWQKNPDSKSGDVDYGEFYSVFADTAGMAASPKFQAWVDHYKNANAAFKGSDAYSLYAMSALFNGHVGAIIAGPWWIDGSWKSGSHRVTGTAAEKKEFAENKIGYQALPAGHRPLDGGWYAGMASTISDAKQQVAEAFIYEMTRPENVDAFSNGLNKFSSRLDTAASSKDKVIGELSPVIASSEKVTRGNFANTDWIWGVFDAAAAAITSTSTYATVAADIKTRAARQAHVTSLLLPVVATS